MFLKGCLSILFELTYLYFMVVFSRHNFDPRITLHLSLIHSVFVSLKIFKATVDQIVLYINTPSSLRFIVRDSLYSSHECFYEPLDVI